MTLPTQAAPPSAEVQDAGAAVVTAGVGLRAAGAPTARRRARAVAVSVAATVVVSIVLLATIATTREVLNVTDLLTLAVGYTLVGGAVAARLPANAFGWVSLAIGAVSAVAAITGAVARPAAVVWVSDWIWWLPYGLLPVALLVFPSGRLPSDRWRLALGVAVAGAVVPALALATAGAVHPDPLGDPPAGGVARDLVLVGRAGAGLGVVALLVAVASLFVRLRTADDLERRQILCIGVGGGVLSLGLVLAALNVADAWALYAIVVPLTVPVAAGVAILWHRLYDLDLVINRSLVYLVLSAVLLAAYGAMVWVGDHLLGAVLPIAGPPVVAAGVIAVGLHPLRARLQRSVDRVLYGDRRDPYAVVTAVARRVAAPSDPRAVLASVAETVADSLALPYVAIEPAADTGVGGAVEWGRRGPDMVTLPLRYAGEDVGRLAVAPRTLGSALSPAERRLLDDLARQVSVTVYALQLSAGLQRSRQALVVTREEERRRLRRDLHDGLGPTLAGIALQCDAARVVLSRDAGAADGLLAAVRDEAGLAIAEIRRVAHGLRPPAIDELGLVGAIRDTARRLGAGSAGAPACAIDVVAPEPQPPLPAAVEVAALRIVQEALANVVRHAGAAHCTVRVATEADALTIAVVDDGQGIPAGAGYGVGLASMRERAVEVGGACAIEPRQEGGTCVRARLPLGSP